MTHKYPHGAQSMVEPRKLECAIRLVLRKGSFRKMKDTKQQTPIEKESHLFCQSNGIFLILAIAAKKRKSAEWRVAGRAFS